MTAMGKVALVCNLLAVLSLVPAALCAHAAMLNDYITRLANAMPNSDLSWQKRPFPPQPVDKSGRDEVTFESYQFIEPNHLEGGCEHENFEFISRIGSGGFGEVFKGRHRTTRKEYALKVIAGGFSHLKNEEKIQKGINADNIVKMYCAYKHEKKIYLVLEYVDGTDLYENIRLKKRSPELNKQFVREILEMVAFLHENHIVFRDFKPENLMVTQDNHLKLIDFGLAVQCDAGSCPVLTSLVGTPYFCAPEVIYGIPYSYKVDLYSVGLIAYELITGMPPFPEYHDNPSKMFRIILRGVNYPLSQMNPISHHFLERLLEMDPKKRISSARKALEHPYFLLPVEDL